MRQICIQILPVPDQRARIAHCRGHDPAQRGKLANLIDKYLLVTAAVLQIYIRIGARIAHCRGHDPAQRAS